MVNRNIMGFGVDRYLRDASSVYGAATKWYVAIDQPWWVGGMANGRCRLVVARPHERWAWRAHMFVAYIPQKNT